MSGESRGEPKETLLVEPAKLGELARDSVRTTQMDPAALRDLIGNAVPPIDELATQKRTAQGMRPLTTPPATRALSSSEIVELGADDRKSRKQRALVRPRAAAMPRTTLVLLSVVAIVSVVALVGWLR